MLPIGMMADKLDASVVSGVLTPEFRKVMGRWTTGISVITTCFEGVLAGLVSNSFTSVSLEPPLVSWCVDTRSSSLELWLHTDNFAVHVLGEADRAFVARFAQKGQGKFSGIDWQPGTCGSPVIDDRMLRLDCSVWSRHQAGDHVIIVGLVIGTVQRGDFDPLTNRTLYPN
ncbi:MAG: flavin reductase family protein [Microbacteriaceae bacterium]